MDPSPRYQIRAMTDRAALEELLRLRWSDASILVAGKFVTPKDVNALAAYDADRLAGVATWRLEGEVLYLITLNNITDQRGIGTALLDATTALARESGAKRMRVIVTNDNLNALRFYQRRGFRLVALHVGVVDEMRKLKPSIPRIGANRIPMRDEIELEIDL
jgi:GNAT superfamily N-acetyltransferase